MVVPELSAGLLPDKKLLQVPPQLSVEHTVGEKEADALRGAEEVKGQTILNKQQFKSTSQTSRRAESDCGAALDQDKLYCPLMGNPSTQGCSNCGPPAVVSPGHLLLYFRVQTVW